MRGLPIRQMRTNVNLERKAAFILHVKLPIALSHRLRIELASGWRLWEEFLDNWHVDEPIDDHMADMDAIWPLFLAERLRERP